MDELIRPDYQQRDIADQRGLLLVLLFYCPKSSLMKPAMPVYTDVRSEEIEEVEV